VSLKITPHPLSQPHN